MAKFETFLDNMADYPKETLHFIHTHVPHAPWIRLPAGQRYEKLGKYPHGLERQGWSGSRWEMLQAWQRHLLQVGLVDTLVGRLDARLSELGLDEEALLIVTADHGTSFRHGDRRRNFHGPRRAKLHGPNLTELVNVPLFVRYPGAPPGADLRNATTLDVLPTVLAGIGVEPPEALAGQSLFGPAPQLNEKLTYQGSSFRSKLGPERRYRVGDLDRGAEVERVARWFGRGDWSSVFRLASRPELLDRSPESLATREQPLTLVLTAGRGLDRFDSEAAVLPIHLAGIVRDESIDPDPIDLAIAARGRIVATTRTFVDPGGVHNFTVLLDPDLLVGGDNELAIFAVRGDQANPRLQPTRLRWRRRRR